MFIGLILLLLGLLLLLNQLGYIEGRVWDYFWPLALMALGLSFIFEYRRKDKS